MMQFLFYFSFLPLYKKTEDLCFYCPVFDAATCKHPAPYNKSTLFSFE